MYAATKAGADMLMKYAAIEVSRWRGLSGKLAVDGSMLLHMRGIANNLYIRSVHRQHVRTSRTNKATAIAFFTYRSAQMGSGEWSHQQCIDCASIVPCSSLRVSEAQ